MLEKNITNKIIKYLNSLDRVKAWKVHSGSYATPSKADITGSYRGLRFDIEVKRPGNKPTAAQFYFLESMKKTGSIAFWTDSLENVKIVFDALHEKIDEIDSLLLLLN